MHRPAILFLAAMLLLIASSAGGADAITSAIADLSTEKSKADRLAALKLLRDSNEDVRALAAIEPLKAACKDDDEEIRYQAVLALGLMCWNQAQPGPIELVEAMLDPSDRIRTNAAAIVGEVGELPREAVPVILKCAAHPNAGMRVNAMSPLGRFAKDDPLLLAVLHQAAHDRDVLVRSNAAAAIFKATGDLAQVVPYWLLLTQDSDQPADDEGISATSGNLASLGAAMMLRENGIKHPRQMCEVLVNLVDSDVPVLRRTATQNLRALAAASAESKQVLVAQDIPDLLRKLRDDPDREVAMFATLGLKEFEQPDNSDDADSQE